GGRIEKRRLATATLTGISWPTTSTFAETRPAPAHEAVRRARPACVVVGTVQRHSATPFFAWTAPRPGCVPPPLYRTESEQRAERGLTATRTATSPPWSARAGRKLKRSDEARAVAVPAATA